MISRLLRAGHLFNVTLNRTIRVLLAVAGGILASQMRASTPHPSVAGLKGLTLAELMDLEVTSVSRRGERLADTASAVQVVTGDDLQRSGAFRLPSALRLLANMQVAQIDSRQWAVAARGFNNTLANKMLVLLDGRPLYTPLFAGVFWDVQDTFLLDVDRIEAISGPGATQWGSNAVNGVINITTRDARDTQGGILHAGAGTELRRFAEGRYGGTLAPGLFYRVYGKHFERDNSRLPSGQSATDAWHLTQGGFRVDWDRSTRDLVTVQGDRYTGHVAQLNRDRVAVNGSNLIGRWTRTFAPQSELRVQALYDHTYRRAPGSITENLDLYEVDVQNRINLGDPHDFLWGATHRRMQDRVTNPESLAFLPARVSREWYAFFAQNTIALPQRRVRVTLGAKTEHNPYTNWEFQPSLRVAWKLRETQLLWGAVSRALRTPSRIDRELYTPATPPYTIAGGPNFHSEKLIAYELGYRTQPIANLSFSASTFYHDYDDLRSLEPSPGNPALVANGIKGHSYGAELTADYRVSSRWRLRAGYTEQRVHSALKPGSLDQTNTRSQSLDPNRQLVLQSELDLTSNVTCDLTGRHVGRIANHQVPSYSELDARVGWRVTPRVELAIIGKNLLQPRHAEFGPLITRREIQRSYNGTVLWRF